MIGSNSVFDLQGEAARILPRLPVNVAATSLTAATPLDCHSRGGMGVRVVGGGKSRLKQEKQSNEQLNWLLEPPVSLTPDGRGGGYCSNLLSQFAKLIDFLPVKCPLALCQMSSLV